MNFSSLSVGSEVELPFGGSLKTFKVLSLNYNSAKLGTGKMLLIYKNGIPNLVWGSGKSYSESGVAVRFQQEYEKTISSFKERILLCRVPYSPSTSATVSELNQFVFTLSATELGYTNYGQNANVEGETIQAAVDFFSSLTSGYKGTRTQATTNFESFISVLVSSSGGINSYNTTAKTYSTIYYPCIVIDPAENYAYYKDSNGNAYDEQEYEGEVNFEFPNGEAVPIIKIENGSYIGNGTYGTSNPTSITFSSKPEIIFVMANKSDRNRAKYRIIVIKDIPMSSSDDDINSSELLLTWSDSTVSWSNYRSSYEQLNDNRVIYYYSGIIVG